MLAFFWWFRQKKRKQKSANQNGQSTATDDGVPYLQQKAELEDQERRKYELEARETGFEMDGENQIYEVVSEGDGRRMSRFQELRGEEHLKELEGHSNL